MTSEVIVVPEISWPQIVSRARTTLGLTYVDQHIENPEHWKRRDRAEAFEVLAWKPKNRFVTNLEILEYFHSQGFQGDPYAFMLWVMRHDPVGWLVSVPKVSQLTERYDTGTLYYFKKDKGRCLLSCSLRHQWSCGWTYVGFRKLRNQKNQKAA